MLRESGCTREEFDLEISSDSSPPTVSQGSWSVSDAQGEMSIRRRSRHAVLSRRFDYSDERVAPWII